MYALLVHLEKNYEGELEQWLRVSMKEGGRVVRISSNGGMAVLDC
jgi:hypothetical protein